MAVSGLANLAAASAIHGHLHVGIVPDAGDPDRAWLQSAGWGYPGVLVGTPPVPEAVVIQHFVYRRRRRLRAKKRSFD